MKSVNEITYFPLLHLSPTTPFIYLKVSTSCLSFWYRFNWGTPRVESSRDVYVCPPGPKVGGWGKGDERTLRGSWEKSDGDDVRGPVWGRTRLGWQSEDEWVWSRRFTVGSFSEVYWTKTKQCES